MCATSETITFSMWQDKIVYLLITPYFTVFSPQRQFILVFKMLKFRGRDGHIVIAEKQSLLFDPNTK